MLAKVDEKLIVTLLMSCHILSILLHCGLNSSLLHKKD